MQAPVVEHGPLPGGLQQQIAVEERHCAVDNDVLQSLPERSSSNTRSTPTLRDLTVEREWFHSS
eukprot:5582281-Amphidinium_carterae.1